MQILRRLFLSGCALILGVSLVALAWSHALSITFRNQETVKSWLAESGLYEDLGDTMIDQVADNAGSDIGRIADNQEVRDVIGDALGNNLLQQSVERLVDVVYDWLEGGELPQTFSVDIADARQRLADGLGNYAARRSEALPVCTQAQALALSSNFDIWTAPCRPEPVSAEQVRATVSQELSAAIGDTGAAEIDPASILGENSNNPPEDIRRAYSYSKWLPPIFVAVALLSTILIVLLSSTRWKGASRAGWVYVSSGITVALSALILAKGPSLVRSGLKNTLDQSAADLVVRIIEVAGRDVSNVLWWYAGALALIGLLAVMLAKVLGRPKSPKPETAVQASEPMPPVDDSPKTTPTAERPVRPANRPPRPPRKIQL